MDRVALCPVVACLAAVLYFSLQGCSSGVQPNGKAAQRIDAPSDGGAFHVLAEGSWRNWRSWPSPAGNWILLTYEAERGGDRRFDVVDTRRRVVRPITAAAHKALGEGVPVDAQWAPDGSAVAIELESHEFAEIVVLEVERDIARSLRFEGLPGSRSPRWNASGDALYFVPFLLDADDREKGLYEYRVKEGWIGRVLPDSYVSKEIAVADDVLYGVSVVNPGPQLFAASLSDLHAQAKHVATWDDTQGRFVPVVAD